MFNQIIERAMSIGFLIAIISLAPVSAVRYTVQGRWDLSEATKGENLILYIPRPDKGDKLEDGQWTPALTFTVDHSWLSWDCPGPYDNSQKFRKVYMTLANKELTEIKDVFVVSSDGVKIPWDNEYPNLCLVQADWFTNQKFSTPTIYDHFLLWPASKFRETAGAFTGTLAMKPPKYLMIEMLAFAKLGKLPPKNPPLPKFEFKGVWNDFNGHLPLAHLHYRDNAHPVFQLKNKRTLTLSNEHYSRAYVALANEQLNQIKKIFLLDQVNNKVKIPFETEHPNLCLLRVDSEAEEPSHNHPKTFNDYQDWLDFTQGTVGVFIGISPHQQVEQLLVERVEPFKHQRLEAENMDFIKTQEN